MGIEEVLFRKGEPNQKEKEFWFYLRDSDTVGHLIRLTEDGRTVKAIQAFTKDGKEFYLPTIQGISHYSTQEDIERRFGKPDNVSVYKDRTLRMLSYPRYKLAFELERNRVTSIAVFDGKRPVRFQEEANNDLLGIRPKPAGSK